MNIAGSFELELGRSSSPGPLASNRVERGERGERGDTSSRKVTSPVYAAVNGSDKL